MDEPTTQPGPETDAPPAAENAAPGFGDQLLSTLYRALEPIRDAIDGLGRRVEALEQRSTIIAQPQPEVETTPAASEQVEPDRMGGGGEDEEPARAESTTEPPAEA